MLRLSRNTCKLLSENHQQFLFFALKNNKESICEYGIEDKENRLKISVSCHNDQEMEAGGVRSFVKW